MNKIYYFSGTGNTLASAKQIASALGIGDTQVIPISACIDKEEYQLTADKVVVMFPAYAYSLPGMVRKFLKKVEFKCAHLSVITTYATSYGGSLAAAKRLLKRKRQPDYFAAIKCVENFIPIFGQPKEQEKRIAEQKEQTALVAEQILAGEKNTTKHAPFGCGYINLMLRYAAIFAPPLKVLKNCTGCGVCASLCPTHRIKIKNGKAKLRGKCELCQACLNFCPQKAIKYSNKITPETGRYTHPDVTAEEMNR